MGGNETMTNKKIDDFETNLVVEKLTLKNIDIPKFNMKDMITKLNQEIYDSAFNQLVNEISEDYPDMPIEVVEAFVKCYFSFEIDNEYDIKTKSYKFKVTPVWKAAELIDTESEEFKLCHEYSLSTL